jgi:Xaa-Pro aminopeptidase
LKLGIDKIGLEGLWAFNQVGFEVVPGEEAIQKARAIKNPNEILAMRCAIHACEKSVEAMHNYLRPFISENELWSVLHAENIKRGGEWIETRLLTSGPRTNPWFQECGPRIIQNNEIIAFDTDLIGCYGMCVDISRSWWLGDQAPRKDMIFAMQHAYEHIMTNMEMLEPGVRMRDLSKNCHQLKSQYQENKYGCIMHGVGLADEWPVISYPDGLVDGAYDYEIEPGMIFALEALVSEKGGDFSIKLEEQVLITETGYEKLSNYPFDDRLLPGMT